jgi:hypothetical protein
LHIDPGAIVNLAGVQPEWWSQIVLEPDVMEGSISMIMIKFSRFSQPVEIAERMRAWDIVNQDRPDFQEYRATALHQLKVGQLDALRRDFDMTHILGDDFKGNMVILARGSDLWEIVVLCALDETPECERALSTVLDTFQFDLAAIEGNSE